LKNFPPLQTKLASSIQKKILMGNIALEHVDFTMIVSFAGFDEV
jgi:hypothetical protein